MILDSNSYIWALVQYNVGSHTFMGMQYIKYSNLTYFLITLYIKLEVLLKIELDWIKEHSFSARHEMGFAHRKFSLHYYCNWMKAISQKYDKMLIAFIVMDPEFWLQT